MNPSCRLWRKAVLAHRPATDLTMPHSEVIHEVQSIEACLNDRRDHARTVDKLILYQFLTLILFFGLLEIIHNLELIHPFLFIVGGINDDGSVAILLHPLTDLLHLRGHLLIQIVLFALVEKINHRLGG